MSLFHTLRVIFLKSIVCFLLPGISWGMEVESDFINKINPNKNIEKKQDIIPSNNKAFYIFSVGQGNAQLAVYSNFSVLYDCGSKSSSSYSKVYDLHREEYELFLKKKAEKIDIGDMDFGNDLEIKEQSPDRKNSGNSKSSGEFSDNTNTLISKIERKDLGTQIYQVLDSLSSKKLFVFLSHPDEDHINLLSSSIPNNFDVVAFLCGDWLGEGAQNKDKSNLSDPVQQILTYLFNRDQEKTWVELPYYWGYQRTWKDNDSWGFGMFQYKDILKKLTMEAKEKFTYGMNKARQQYNDIVTKYQHSKSGFKFFLDKFDTIKINTIYDNMASCKNNEDKLIW